MALTDDWTVACWVWKTESTHRFSSRTKHQPKRCTITYTPEATSRVWSNSSIRLSTSFYLTNGQPQTHRTDHITWRLMEFPLQVKVEFGRDADRRRRQAAAISYFLAVHGPPKSRLKISESSSYGRRSTTIIAYEYGYGLASLKS